MRLAERSLSTVSNDRKSRIRSLLSDPAGLSAPGYAVGIFREGRIAELVTIGARDVSASLPIDENTQFYVGSVSKQFTALALMQLVAAGRMTLNDDIRSYLPEMPLYDQTVTVSMLLHHTAGIREFLALVMLAGYSDYSAPTRSDALDLILHQRNTDFEPGTRFNYSNGGYLLLSEIVERVADEPFSELVRRTILGPLGMSRSYVLAGERPNDANVARGYQVNHGHVTLSDNYPLFGGSGGLISTLGDLAKYDHDIDTGKQVWTPQISRLMLVSGRCANGQTVMPAGLIGTYASGLMLGPAWNFHSGAAMGLKANYARLPERRIGLAVLCNRGEIDLDERVNAIVETLDEQLPPVVVTAPESMLGRYASKDLDVVYELACKGGRFLKIRILSSDDNFERGLLMLTRMDDESFIGSDIRLVLGDENRNFILQRPDVTLAFNRI